jgi:hypothetical protein
MDFLIVYKLLKNNRYWWLDALSYFSIALLIALIASYGIFWLRVILDQKAIAQESTVLASVGTEQQKDQEKQVLSYVQKMNDFNTLLKAHRFSSNVFQLIQDKTMPYIWFNQFTLDEKNNAVQLFGESDSVESLSRQIINFENSDYVEKISLLNSRVGLVGKLVFNINIQFKPNIFDYIERQTPSSQNTSSQGQ